MFRMRIGSGQGWLGAMGCLPVDVEAWVAGGEEIGHAGHRGDQLNRGDQDEEIKGDVLMSSVSSMVECLQCLSTSVVR